MTLFPNSIRRSRSLVLVFLLVVGTATEAAYGQKGGRHYGGGSGGKNFFSLGPGGFSYGYSDGNLGILLGPVGGNYGHQHYRSYDSRYLAPGYGGGGYAEEIIYDAPAGGRSGGSYRVTPSNASPSSPPEAVIATNAEAAEFQLQAEQAFRAHDYARAERLMRHAIVEDFENGRLHLFNSQVLFATGDYEGAIAALDMATQILDESGWGFVVESFRLFYNNGDYVKQMDQLVQFTKDNPQVATPRVLRGYHYLYLGHKESAKKQFKLALEIDAADPVARRFLALYPEEVQAPVPVDDPEVGDSDGK